VSGAAFSIVFHPRGARETDRDACAMFLAVRDYAHHPSIRLNFEFWFEAGGKKQHKEIGEFPK
jgi:hypothetical protein